MLDEQGWNPGQTWTSEGACTRWLTGGWADRPCSPEMFRNAGGIYIEFPNAAFDTRIEYFDFVAYQDLWYREGYEGISLRVGTGGLSAFTSNASLNFSGIGSSSQTLLSAYWTGSEYANTMVAEWVSSYGVYETFRLRSITIAGTGTNPMTGVSATCVTPTPLPTATSTPDLTLTPAWYVPSFIPLADCTTPVYADRSPAVSFGVYHDGSACYRIIPQVDILITDPDIHIPAIDLCLEFYTVFLTVVGLTIYLDVLVSVGFCLLLMRWALFN